MVISMLVALLGVTALPASASSQSGDTTITVPIPGTPCKYVITVDFDTGATPPAHAYGQMVCSGE